MAAAVCSDFARLVPPPSQITMLADARLPSDARGPEMPPRPSRQPS